MREQLWGSDKIEAELEAAKSDLRGLEKNIRKILGRDAPGGENGNTQAPARTGQKRALQEDRRRQVNDFSNNAQGSGPKGRRRWVNKGNAEPKTVFSRLSARIPSTVDDSGDDDDYESKPAVSSRVTITPRVIPSRQEVLRREKVDERSRQRNKRMFGALLGTLQKFCQEESRLKEKEEKKAEVEARVEEAKRREREEMRKERQQLFLSRKQQLAQVRSLEAKLERSKQYQEWRAAQIPLLRYIKTHTNPPIYYLPKQNNPQTDTLLAESSNALKAEIDRREKELLKEFDDIEGIGRDRIASSQRDTRASSESKNEEEGEENLDPNYENNDDVTNISLPDSPPQQDVENMGYRLTSDDIVLNNEMHQDEMNY